MAWLSWNAEKQGEGANSASEDVNEIVETIGKLGIQE
jgi:hypothetical protein